MEGAEATGLKGAATGDLNIGFVATVVIEAGYDSANVGC